MTMSRKHSRLITVDGTPYRWTLGGSSRQDVSDRNIVVELAESPQSTLVATPTAIDIWFGDDYIYEVTPALVETGIRKAIRLGWNPSASGTFRLLSDYDKLLR